MQEITVHVVKYGDRKNLAMRYVCPITGKQVKRSTGTSIRSKAEKIAAKWEAELQEGRYQRDARMPWEEFRELFEEAKAATVRPGTAIKYATTFGAFEAFCRPRRVGDLTTQKVTAFAADLRRRRERTRKVRVDGELTEVVESYTISEATVASHLRSLKAIARWAHRQGLLTAVPSFDMPKGSATARMKGRPITTEELERMLAAVEGVVGPENASHWKSLLWGLWWSGLRLGEALALRWDQTAGGNWVVLDGRHSVLAFDAGSQKSGKVELVPLAPEAVEFLEPLKREAGAVFKLPGASRRVLAVGRRLAAIGKAAGVVTDPEKGRTATAHDLRRAFGHRWSKRVMPAELKAVMRHSSIETTMTYYVGQNARATAAELWNAVKMGGGTVSGTTGPDQAEEFRPRNAKTPAEAGVA